MKRHPNKRDIFFSPWEKRWPNHCPKCKGWGEISYTQNQAPLGSGHYWPETLTEPCSCVEEGICPRCAATPLQESGNSGGTVCPKCGWDSTNPDGLVETYDADS